MDPQQLWNSFLAWMSANESPIQTIAALIGIVVGIITIAQVISIRRPSSPLSPHEVTEFHTLWPKLSLVLGDDLKQSIASATEARILATDESGRITHVQNVQPPKIVSESGYHWKTISRYDQTLGKQLNEYLAASQALRAWASKYNKLIYGNKTHGDEFRDTKFKMYKASRRLEDAADALDAQVKHYDDVIPKSN